MKAMTVIDFFCGAGGFSEGFRQQGYKILMGIDNWQPAINTYNYNFNLDCKAKNILEFQNSVDEIENLPDTDVILGSPPCVSFSSSNNSGKANKDIGILLTKTFLRIVAVKKFKKNSLLKAWFMENVGNSTKFLSDSYTFEDLNLVDWALKNSIEPNKVAITLVDNQPIINSADYGSIQNRKRVISGEIISKEKLIIPNPTHKNSSVEGNQENHLQLKYLSKKMPSPSSKRSHRIIQDPFYPEIKIKACELSDHFYDTGLYKSEWQQAKYLKTNHPYMGKMSFPENLEKPSRTITATKIASSREAIIYKSEVERFGDGEYRTATVREAACIMGFPMTYQFIGSEGMKWRLVGNAVCPAVSRAFAKQLKIELKLKVKKKLTVTTSIPIKKIQNLNTYSEKEFTKPPTKNKNSRFRRHPFKDGNLTVTLSNYDIPKNGKTTKKWITSVQYGTGNGFPTYNFPNEFHKTIKPIIQKTQKGKVFINLIDNGFSDKIPCGYHMQTMYEEQNSHEKYLQPIELIEEVAILINQLEIDDEYFAPENNKIFKKKIVPLKQLFALYAINKISSIANRK